ncbi:melatonin receptor type 1B-B-like [Strongylocentrotus purpuratus]|uniref:G-protein coupled receptors family 1 profile domain-containing protein n=1 Tax=Strongylocentrotus purpuratus TaxID=7668 RepID=A0A7M7T0U1_STRPU|nr:melatonin receptor type 1B-B-like [Strongylocentrotus purpuratus]
MTTTSISFGSVADVLLSTISTSFENHMPSTSMLEPVSTAFPNSTLNQTAPDSTGSNGNPTATQVVLMAAFIICMIWGNIGNMLVMGAILIDKKLRNTVANIFIFNLAIADFCVTSFVDLSYVLGNIYPQLFKSKSILCNMAASVCIISCTCSMWSICSISINRYICITKSKYYGTIYTRRNTLLMTASLWILCAFIDLPNYIGLGAHIFDVKKMGCSFDRLGHYGYTFYFIGMGVVIPLCLVLFCYIRVFIFVRESERRIHSWQTQGDQAARSQMPRVSKADRRLMITVFIIFIVFLTCWTPYVIIVLTDVNNVYPKELYVGAVIMAHLNSSLNSILYGITNRRFREGYKRLLLIRRCGCGISVNNTNNSTTESADPDVGKSRACEESQIT